MIRGLAASLALCLWPLMLAAQPVDPAQAARAAAKALEAAAVDLSKADSARDRVKALTITLKAYEDGLEAMRDGLRRVALREARLTQDLHSREAEVARLLGVLQSIGAAPAPVAMLHPDGPTGTARAGMLLADVTPALNTKAAELRVKLEEVKTLRTLQESAADTLRRGLDGVQKARADLSQALADRTNLPKRFTEDPVKTAILISSTETLEGFASGLYDITEDEAAGSLPDISHRKGELPLPVQGRVLLRADESDAAGIARPGVVLATRPRALVTTPTAATIRYLGPLLDYGNVMILEPQAGLLFVLAGLDTVYGHAGEVLPSGSPVGLMGGADAGPGTILSQAGDGAGTQASETLYIEVRQDNATVDPAVWFKMKKEE
ncbi:Septal ring factor EnvC, activator of murein hydrolases AmiA and AmiB [Thalassovita litoralis]|jgi:septal ring factor EnvC (AmiA/AmiB activator)|uniref:Septal ring factor EnvC, activator of murein hydrolases AmiA and AmiB n=1 Tax=Thalassovita litoralis TaxID=1010611 RepID=A0A521AK33_9RHOB|nr:peptidoglycan DD-metalloendopeptidase family protein [Thalassovita litoralis]SMO35194.1 Septal ring factor EnvC, activator of murein hydrolases AmiA and AmiB [Thalassovita litoralis]